ncbi:MAG: hypothetical protein RIR51_251 [Bacteroidota bacterium]|jgi:hypothetical protein
MIKLPLKTLLILILIIVHTIDSSAQSIRYKKIYKEFYSETPIHYGFSFGFPSIKLFNNQISLPTTGGIYKLSSPNNLGIQIGGTLTYILNQQWDIKSGLNVALYDRVLEYYDSTKVKTQFNPFYGVNPFTGIEIPLLFKLKSKRRYNNSAYAYFGIKYSKAVSVKKSISKLDLKSNDLSIEYGIGFDQFFQYFKFSPEIRFSHGLLNQFKGTDPALGIEPPVLTNNSVGLVLNFE